MKIFVTIQKSTKTTHYDEPDKYNFDGNYAIETMLIKISEKYFGVKISLKIEDLLKQRVDSDEKFEQRLFFRLCEKYISIELIEQIKKYMKVI